LKNYSNRLTSVSGVDFDQRREALSFVVHFVGDIHQPLHVSGRQGGGNEARAHFFRYDTTLHYVWDDLILERKMKTGKFQTYENYANDLFKRYMRSSFFSSRMAIVANSINFDPNVFQKWAVDVNFINCEHVWPMYDENDGELEESYYEQSIIVVERQIMKGAIRLGQLLNVLTNKNNESFPSLIII
jgi:pterin-4a-carbinolamine dehydratase